MTPLLRLLPLVSLLAVALTAAEPALPEPVVPVAAAPKAPERSQWVFSLLPKAFQKNPNVDLTIITEMTDLGKKQPSASPQHPVYYLAQSAGYNPRGYAPAKEVTLKPKEVERLLARALAVSGFQPAQPPEHPPTLVIIYSWGSHNLLTEGDEENPTLSGDMVARNILDRAALVGGEKFALKMLQLFEQADELTAAASGHLAPGGQAVLGPEQLEFINPVNMFRRESAKNDFLLDQTSNDVYYVVASAYDYASIPTRVKRLYWRTRMTVAAQGVSQEQTLPTLITSAGPYFGKDMAESEILSKRAVPEGKVEIGEPIVVGNAEALPTAPSPPKNP